MLYCTVRTMYVPSTLAYDVYHLCFSIYFSVKKRYFHFDIHVIYLPFSAQSRARDAVITKKVNIESERCLKFRVIRER